MNLSLDNRKCLYYTGFRKRETMKEKLEKLLKVFKIELEDLESDIALLEETYNKREKKGEITHYVFMENIGLLKSEIAGISAMLRSVDCLNIDVCSSLEDLRDAIDKFIRKKTEELNLPPAVYELVKRKLMKVYSYVLTD